MNPCTAAIDGRPNPYSFLTEEMISVQDDIYTLERFLADLSQIVSEAAAEQAILARVAPLAKRVATWQGMVD